MFSLLKNGMKINAITGVIRIAVMFRKKKDQSVIKAFAGIAIKVIALKRVPKTLRPEAHHGIRPPPTK